MKNLILSLFLLYNLNLFSQTAIDYNNFDNDLATKILAQKFSKTIRVSREILFLLLAGLNLLCSHLILKRVVVHFDNFQVLLLR